MAIAISRGGRRRFGTALAAGSAVPVAGPPVASASGGRVARPTAQAVAAGLFAIAIRGVPGVPPIVVIASSSSLSSLVGGAWGDGRAAQARWSGRQAAWAS